MRKFALIFSALVAATLLFRLPALLNARDLNSDAAVVGLQAMHMLHGEWSWFLWGAGYQSSLDSAITAIAFAIFGASPLVLMLVPIFGHLIVTFLALLILKKRIGLNLAALCVLPLVITPWAITSVVIFPPRQWCVTLVFVAIWLLDGASQSRRSLLRYGIGTMCAITAIYVDLFALLFLPGLMALMLMCLFDETEDKKLLVRRGAACAVGLFIGFVFIFVSRLSMQSASTPAKLDVSRISFNAELLWQQCAPFALGYALYKDNEIASDRGLWIAPAPWYTFQVLAGWSLVMFIATGAMLKSSWTLRRLGLYGFLTATSVPMLFLVSAQPYDMWAVRYLAPIFWMAPFAIAPLAVRWGAKRFAIALTPYLVVAAIGGWLSYGFWVNGPLPRDHASISVAETDQLCNFLRERNIRAGFTDFWLAYRLTFIEHENPILAPLDHDRYEPYQIAANNQPVRAYVFHPTWSRSPREQTERELKSQNIQFESVEIGRFKVLLARPNPGGPGETPNPLR